MKAHASLLGARAAVSFSFVRPGRHPKVQVSLVEALLLRGLTTRADAQGLRVHASSREPDVSTSDKSAVTKLHMS